MLVRWGVLGQEPVRDEVVVDGLGLVGRKRKEGRPVVVLVCGLVHG